MTRYFALVNDDELVDLGERESSTDALRAAPAFTRTVFTEEELRHFVARAISILLGD